MLNNRLKIMYCITLAFVLFSTTLSHAKIKVQGEEVDEPAANPKVNYSDAVILAPSYYSEYNPLNPVPIGINVDEYNQVDNYNIDLKTLDLRIKYFSPTYKNIKQSALSSYYMAYYARGGNDTLKYNAKSYTKELIDLSNEYKSYYNKYKRERELLSKDDPEYAVKDAVLKAKIETYEGLFKSLKLSYDTTNKTINSTKSMLGLGKALYNIGNVDNNGQITFARELITKSMTSAILSYLELNTYISILEKQCNMYYDMYVLYQKNNALGLATANDVLLSLSNYENAKDALKTTSTTFRNIKEQIASNLGYKLSDIDKLNFIEPEVDFEYVYSIDFEEDKKIAYNSNSQYYNVKLNSKDKKLPGSTGEELLNRKKDYIAAKVIAEIDNVHSSLQASLLNYEASIYQNGICELNEKANIRKLETKLVSELEYRGLELKNSAERLQVKSAKYKLINAINDYYYGVRGHLDIV